MLRPLLLTMITLASAGCWGKTVVRVLNAETGEPIADARVSPIPEDIFGSPYYARAVATNENGYATLPYPGWRLYGDEVNPHGIP